MQLIDSHCHLDDVRFDQDRDIILARAADHGIDSYIVPAVSRSSWPKLQTLAATHHNTIHPAYGLHPWLCLQHNHGDLDQLPLFLEQAVAVGECGLDGGRANSGEQLYWFRAQLDLALAMHLPVIIHAYKAVDEVCRELRRRPALTGVIHGFSGSPQQAETVITQGFYLGIGSSITYPQNKRLQGIVTEMPLERLLIESDAPDQPPYTRRGQRNEPAFLLEIVQQLATLRAADTASIADQCNRNVRELFRL
ncbi:TatD family hydrolase [Mariprofundus ferrooxydans]|uniref:TatD family hydrolase n=1 Tax=Mariprofundus ferrooxydans TaxID=314344 RepID=UPI00143190B9|nr:TatD family hydrolase [Mariprofundus ferrooxydans]